MEQNIVYDPISQNDAAQSSCSDLESEPLADQYKGRQPLVSYTKRSAVIVAFLLLYTVFVVSLTLRVTHENRRVGRRFLDTPVDNNYIVYDARVMDQWEDQGDEGKKSQYVEYFAEPSEEIDRNWHDIVERAFSRV